MNTLELNLVESNGRAGAAVAAKEATRNGYHWAFAGVQQRGNAFPGRLQECLRENFEEFAADVSVPRVSTLAQDPGLAEYLCNYDPSSAPPYNPNPDVPPSPGAQALGLLHLLLSRSRFSIFIVSVACSL